MSRSEPQDSAFAPREPHHQRPARAVPGARAVTVAGAGAVLAAALIALGLRGGAAAVVVAGGAIALAVALLSAGFVVVAPNDACVLLLFGRYTGTIAEAGWWWVNPFTALWRWKISLRVRNFQGERIKVNDASGNPIEIAAVVVWRVTDTAKATLDVSEYTEVMLRRQQAEAILAARKTMVAGAVGIVRMALAQLIDDDLVEFDPERKAAMVCNLMVVLSGDHAPTPVLNTGSLYT